MRWSELRVVVQILDGEKVRTGTGTGDSGIGTSGWAGSVRESHLFEIDLLHGPYTGDSGGRDAPLYGRRDARRYGGTVRALG